LNSKQQREALLSRSSMQVAVVRMHIRMLVKSLWSHSRVERSQRFVSSDTITKQSIVSRGMSIVSRLVVCRTRLGSCGRESLPPMSASLS